MKKFTDYIWDFEAHYLSYGYNGSHPAVRTTDDTKMMIDFCKDFDRNINRVIYKGIEIYNSDNQDYRDLPAIIIQATGGSK